MPTERNTVNPSYFKPEADLPDELRLADFQMAMQDAYDFFFDVDRFLLSKGLRRLEDMLRLASRTVAGGWLTCPILI